jgi:hypothetical protein
VRAFEVWGGVCKKRESSWGLSEITPLFLGPPWPRYMIFKLFMALAIEVLKEKYFVTKKLLFQTKK